MTEPLPLMRDRFAERLALVREHVRLENEGDLEGVVETFGDAAVYEDLAWAEELPGEDGIRSHYERLLAASADLRIDVLREHASDDAVILEVVIHGSHTGLWRGLPATGRRFEFPLCAVFTFDDDERLAGERIYYDRATVLRQLGVYREPTGALGRMLMALNHPLMMARAYARKLVGR